MSKLGLYIIRSNGVEGVLATSEGGILTHKDEPIEPYYSKQKKLLEKERDRWIHNGTPDYTSAKYEIKPYNGSWNQWS